MQQSRRTRPGSRRRAVLVGALLASGCTLGGTTAGPDAEDPGDPAPVGARRDAHRFLDRATFGATPSEIARVRTMGFGAWIDDQLARPLTPVFGPMAALHACHPHLGPDDEACDDYNPTDEEIDSIGVMRRQLWWQHGRASSMERELNTEVDV